LRIGVLSDSHTNSLEALPGKAIDELTGVDLIIHAGDYTGKDVLDGLRELGDFKGVHGNMDPPGIKAELPKTEFFEVMGFRIGVAHPSEGGIPFKLWRRVREKFGDVDVIIYGHSHWVKNEVIGGVLYLNPGSVTGAFPARYRSIGILSIGEGVKGRIVKL